MINSPSSDSNKYIRYDPNSFYSCRWKNCHSTYSTHLELFRHLDKEHIGRKSNNNLCLSCHWDGCNKAYSKRDHMTSHVRVHIPFKPHHCQFCHKLFKRAQDLKKHITRIHVTDELSLPPSSTNLTPTNLTSPPPQAPLVLIHSSRINSHHPHSQSHHHQPYHQYLPQHHHHHHHHEMTTTTTTPSPGYSTSSPISVPAHHHLHTTATITTTNNNINNSTSTTTNNILPRFPFDTVTTYTF